MKQLISIALIFIIFSSTTLSTYAAPKTMADGTVFDAEFYAETYPDVKNALGTDEATLYNHYVSYGKAEGRMACASTNTQAAAGDELFDAEYYASMNPDVVKAVGTSKEALYQHYINYGKAEGRKPCGNAVYTMTVTARIPDNKDKVLSANEQSIGGVKLEADKPFTPAVILAEMQEVLPTGTPFNDSTYYFWNGYKAGNGLRGGSGCAAFAFLLSDTIYGNAPATLQNTGTLTINQYDIVFLANGKHMAFVTGISADGKTITVAEANFNGAVRWGGTYNVSNICGVIKR